MKKKELTLDERDERAKKLGAIDVIEVEDKRLYLKIPNRNIIGIAWAKMEVNTVEGMEIIAKASAIRDVSDMEILEDDALFLSCMAGIGEFISKIKLKKSTLRTL